MKILIGADPEVFVKDNQGSLLSAHGMIEGSKKNPYLVRNGAVQVDGMALEFNIDPASNEEEFLHNVNDVMAQLGNMIGVDKHIDISAVAEFGSEMIEMQPHEAKELGCDPDYSAWTSEENHPPNVESPFRTAAGHVHIGWTEGMSSKDRGHVGMAESLIKQLDFFLGLPSLLFDKDVKRREMYGKAGCYRPKPYGAEYRTLSNQWLKSDKTMKLVYNNTQEAVKRLLSGDILWDRIGDIQDIINTSNITRAKQIMRMEGIAYV